MRTKKLSLKVKILAGFLLPIVIMAVLTCVSFVMSKAVESDALLAKDESAVFSGIARQMKLDVVQTQQWLSDISATRAMDGLDDGFDEAEKSRQSFLKGTRAFRDMYREENDNASLEKVIQLEKAYQNYYEVGRKMAQAYIDGGPVAGNQMMPEFDNAAETLGAYLTPFIKQQTNELEESMQSIIAQVGYLRTGIMSAGIFIVMSGLLLAWGLTRAIVKPIEGVIENLNTGSVEVSSAAGQVSSSSQSLAEGSSEQAASIEETSSSLEEMSAMTQQNADNAGQARGLMSEANQVVEQANASMSQLTTSMGEISQASEETQKIVKTIDEIAFQTNLLALNAAVEAARAGEAGAGFAVVADEVRNLAMRAADAAKNTAELIEETVKKVGDGSGLVFLTNEAFAKVADSSRKVGDLINEIAAASGEQAQGIEQVNTAVSEMGQITQQNAASAEESASASEELSAQAEQMQAMVGELKAMVDGRRNGSETVQTGKARAKASTSRSARRTTAKSAEQVIPFDDEKTFDEF